LENLLKKVFLSGSLATAPNTYLLAHFLKKSLSPGNRDLFLYCRFSTRRGRLMTVIDQRWLFSASIILETKTAFLLPTSKSKQLAASAVDNEFRNEMQKLSKIGYSSFLGPLITMEIYAEGKRRIWRIFVHKTALRFELIGIKIQNDNLLLNDYYSLNQTHK